MGLVSNAISALKAALGYQGNNSHPHEGKAETDYLGKQVVGIERPVSSS